MNHIANLLVNQSFTNLPFAVKTAEVKLTKTNKEYLAITLFDGEQTISGNMWDFVGAAPNANDIVDISGKVTEWAGKKQLNITYIGVNTNLTIADFAPQGNFSVDEYWNKANSLIDTIKHEQLRDFVRTIYNDFEDKLRIAPGAKSVHNAYVGGCLEHLVDVTTVALSLADCYPYVNKDIVTAGALLHDIGKVFEYGIDGVNIGTTLDGELLYHIPMGMTILDRYRGNISNKILKLIQHIVLSHHGEKEYGSPVVPKFMEAMIVHFADNIDAKMGIMKETNKSSTGTITDKVWSLGNTSLVHQVYIEEVMADE